jgi:hypothetical protein
MNPLPAVVIAAYKRPHCLSRLLQSLQKADYPSGEIPLVISLDGPPTEEVLLIAQSAEWPFGPKKIITHQQHLGIVQHIISCGNLTTEFNNILLLEDDLLVSPAYYTYAVQALKYYRPCVEIAAISLYGYVISENSYQPFLPIDDGYDVYFMQVPSSWGICFSLNQWAGFSAFRKDNNYEQFYPSLPGYVQQWPATSWKKIFFSFLMQQQKYLVYPRQSLCTNFGDPGTHAVTGDLYQVPLLEKTKMFRFCAPGESAALYDAWFELKAEGLNRIYDLLKNFLYEVDLYGTKSPDRFVADYFLTTRTGGTPIKSFGLQMAPPIANVLHNIPGNKIRLVAKNDIEHNGNYAVKYIYGPYKWPYAAGVQDALTLTIAITGNGDKELIEKTIISVEKQSEVVSRVIVVSQKEISEPNSVTGKSLPLQWYKELSGDGFLKTLASESGDICCPILTGSVFTPGILNDVIEIFRRFPEVNWMLGLPKQLNRKLLRTIPQQRWSSNMIQEATAAELLSSFIPGCFFFRKSLLQKLLSRYENMSLLNFIEMASAANEKLFTLANICATVDNIKTPQVAELPKPGKPPPFFRQFLNKVTRPLFLHNTTFLRFFYYELNQLPEVIRKDGEHGSWYLSRY